MLLINLLKKPVTFLGRHKKKTGVALILSGLAVAGETTGEGWTDYLWPDALTTVSGASGSINRSTLNAEDLADKLFAVDNTWSKDDCDNLVGSLENDLLARVWANYDPETHETVTRILVGKYQLSILSRHDEVRAVQRERWDSTLNDGNGGYALLERSTFDAEHPADARWSNLRDETHLALANYIVSQMSGNRAGDVKREIDADGNQLELYGYTETDGEESTSKLPTTLRLKATPGRIVVAIERDGNSLCDVVLDRDNRSAKRLWNGLNHALEAGSRYGVEKVNATQRGRSYGSPDVTATPDFITPEVADPVRVDPFDAAPDLIPRSE